jgi:hypothetical protein
MEKRTACNTHNSNKVALCVTVLASLGGGHFSNLQKEPWILSANFQHLINRSGRSSLCVSTQYPLPCQVTQPSLCSPSNNDSIQNPQSHAFILLQSSLSIRVGPAPHLAGPALDHNEGSLPDGTSLLGEGQRSSCISGWVERVIVICTTCTERFMKLTSQKLCQVGRGKRTADFVGHKHGMLQDSQLRPLIGWVLTRHGCCLSELRPSSNSGLNSAPLRTRDSVIEKAQGTELMSGYP